ncbi:MAG: hypothetical protein ACREHG_00300 [Candidatus Saccharimonadales bacterium]
MQLNTYSIGAKSVVLRYDDGEKYGVRLWSIDTVLDLLIKTYQIDTFDKDETMSDTLVTIDSYYADPMCPDEEGPYVPGEILSLDLYLERIGFDGIEKMLKHQEAIKEERLAAKILSQVRKIANSFKPVV